MTTDLDRLETWMQRNGVDAEQLRGMFSQGTRQHYIKEILAGKRQMLEFFKYRFCCQFGVEATKEVFGLDIDPDNIPNNRASIWRPEYSAAHRAVNDAIKEGELLPAKSHKCHGCYSQAVEYHHQSYRENDRLCVVPLCRKCHRAAHNGKLNVSFGVVPTRVGMVRIAISDHRANALIHS